MPRDLGDVLDYFLPSAESEVSSRSAEPSRRRAPRSRDPARTAERPAALPIVTLPLGDRDVVRTAFAWNLAVEVARRGASATLVAPRGAEAAALWPEPGPGPGPLGAELVLAESRSLDELNRAALDVAVNRAADSTDGGLVLVRVPPAWLEAGRDARSLLRWVLLFASTDPRDLREAFAVTRRVLESGPEARVGITIHGVRRVSEAEHAFAQLAEATTRHLGRSVVSYGLLVDDLHVYRAIVARRPIGLEHPQSRAARALGDVARLLLEDAGARILA